MWKALAFILFSLFLASCSLQTIEPTMPPTATDTSTPTEESTFTATATASPTDAPTSTATATATNTQIPTITPTASVTPFPETLFRADQLALVDLPEIVRDGIDNPLIVFTNSNDQQTIANLATAQPENTVENLYFTAPGSRDFITAISLISSPNNQFFMERTGKAFAYFDAVGLAPGLYIVNVQSSSAFSSRIWATQSLSQRGIYSAPVWTADGEQLAVTLQTAYDLDIFLYSRDGSQRINLTQSGSFDMYPSFSPDGRYMAFVSDRATCPSWIPGDADFCDVLTTPTPYGGQVYLMDLESQETRLLSDQFVMEAPKWLSNNFLVIPAGDQLDLLNPQRSLYLANVATNEVRSVRLAGDDERVMYLDDTWSPDGTTLLAQRASLDSTDVILMTVDGTLIANRTDELTFPRFGMRATWSPLGDRIAIGGSRGRCPYGIRVAQPDFSWVATGNTPSMCDPIFSADGNSIAFMGVTSSVDGRLDIYSATSNGFGAFNITQQLRGTMKLIGWIGG